MCVIPQIIKLTSFTFITLFSPVVPSVPDQLSHHCLLKEGELELEAERTKHSHADAEPAKADLAAHSEILRDTAPVLEGIKVMSLNIHLLISQ